MISIQAYRSSFGGFYDIAKHLGTDVDEEPPCCCFQYAHIGENNMSFSGRLETISNFQYIKVFSMTFQTKKTLGVAGGYAEISIY